MLFACLCIVLIYQIAKITYYEEVLSRLNRFHGHNSVRRVYRNGRPTRTGSFSLYVLEGDRVKRTKAAVVVSRKVHKSAVKRNRIRRRIYEIVRHEMDNIKRPAEIVITVYSAEVADIPADKLQQNIRDLFKKARLLS